MKEYNLARESCIVDVGMVVINAVGAGQEDEF